MQVVSVQVKRVHGTLIKFYKTRLGQKCKRIIMKNTSGLAFHVVLKFSPIKSLSSTTQPPAKFIWKNSYFLFQSNWTEY